MDANGGSNRNLIYHNYITKMRFLQEDDYAILAHIGRNVYFGKDNYFHVNLSQSGEPKITLATEFSEQVNTDSYWAKK